MIEVQDLTKTFGAIRAVDGVSFRVQSGEILGFLGPNGAGKTTTMRVITCFLPPTAGQVQVDGLDVVERSLEVRQKIGYLPENAPLYLDMNVVDYLRFIAAVRRVPPLEVRQKVRHAIEVCGLQTEVQKNLGQLSSGFRQRVGLAQAIMHDPEILVLDEPTRGLDPNQIVEIRGLIRELGRQKTVIFSTHILQEVEALCDRVLIIDKGKIKFDGSKDELSLSASGREQVSLELLADGDVRGALQQVAEVEAVHVLERSDGRVRLRVEATRGSDVRPQLFRTVVAQGWTLVELRRETRSFEDIFRELTMSA